jgi:hypothetical protein
MAQLKKTLVVYLPDTRAVEVSRYGRGNLKIGADVYTYSRLPGGGAVGTCPGASDECERICYAKRIGGVVRDLYVTNSDTDDVPELPDECQVLRLHVSGDFNSAAYVEKWIARLTARPDVQCWAYTRSWRVPSLLPALERLRALPNVQLFASMDQSIDEAPPDGWRRAWIDGDPRAGVPLNELAHVADLDAGERSQRAFDGVPTLVCPEETKHKANCAECGYCFRGHRNDVTFLRH